MYIQRYCRTDAIVLCCAVARTYSKQRASTTHGRVFCCMVKCSFTRQNDPCENLGHVRYITRSGSSACHVHGESAVDRPTALLTQMRLSSGVHDSRSGEEWKNRVLTKNRHTKLEPTLELYIEKKGEQVRRYKEKNQGNSGETFRRPPRADVWR